MVMLSPERISIQSSSPGQLSVTMEFGKEYPIAVFPLMLTPELLIGGKSLKRLITLAAGIANSMLEASGQELALIMAALNYPIPVSAVLVTV